MGPSCSQDVAVSGCQSGYLRQLSAKPPARYPESYPGAILGGIRQLSAIRLDGIAATICDHHVTLSRDRLHKDSGSIAGGYRGGYS
eukprot:6561476-Prymnesium_polylepis.1